MPKSPTLPAHYQAVEVDGRDYARCTRADCLALMDPVQVRLHDHWHDMQEVTEASTVTRLRPPAP